MRGSSLILAVANLSVKLKRACGKPRATPERGSPAGVFAAGLVIPFRITGMEINLALSRRPVGHGRGTGYNIADGLGMTTGPTPRRDGREDEGDGLENRYTGNCIVGSNPTPSAR